MRVSRRALRRTASCRSVDNGGPVNPEGADRASQQIFVINLLHVWSHPTRRFGRSPNSLKDCCCYLMGRVILWLHGSRNGNYETSHDVGGGRQRRGFARLAT
ncbi:uncharacterized protein LOC126355852 [Schistocerca gregaria]|uniref:uncharacterized protein LOC126355852 n=1 Tax=Schistocerca gregaria TaxID=7010 RepID=UPI00211E9FF1|nr:uncharacterized protein LOC126355852 [Schistocerca gregaria]